MRRIIFGLLTLIATAAPAAAGPIAYTVQSNGNGRLYAVDLATGVATDQGARSFTDAEGLAFANDRLYAIGGTTAQFWDLTSAPGTLIGATGPRNGIDAGLDFDRASGTMYNIQGDFGGSSLYTVNLATGAATLVGSNGNFGDSLAISAAGVAYSADTVFTNSLYRINLATGASTLIGSLGIGAPSAQSGMSFDDDGNMWMLLSNGEIYKVNATTGAATLQSFLTIGGNRSSGFEGLAIDNQLVAVPEPASIVSLGIGALCAAGFARRRKAAKA